MTMCAAKKTLLCAMLHIDRESRTQIIVTKRSHHLKSNTKEITHESDKRARITYHEAPNTAANAFSPAMIMMREEM
jgi:hypothetical protein